MTREHRELKDGIITVTPFTPEEEAIADQKNADRLTAEILFNSDNARLDRAFTLSDKDRIIFKTLLRVINRVIVLEGGVALTSEQFKTFIKNQLP